VASSCRRPGAAAGQGARPQSSSGASHELAGLQLVRGRVTVARASTTPKDRDTDSTGTDTTAGTTTAGHQQPTTTTVSVSCVSCSCMRVHRMCDGLYSWKASRRSSTVYIQRQQSRFNDVTRRRRRPTATRRRNRRAHAQTSARCTLLRSLCALCTLRLLPPRSAFTPTYRPHRVRSMRGAPKRTAAVA